MRDVLVSARGQHDNLGDSVLRRGLLDALRPLGRLVVNVEGLPEGYLAALGLHPDDVLVRDHSEWARRNVAGVRAGAVFGFNAGETYATGPYVARLARATSLVALSRLRGGGGVHTGLGLRSRHRVWGPATGLALMPCSVVAWRDAESRSWTHRGTVAPDWAYAFGASATDLEDAREGHGRGLLAVSLRGDRPAPDEGWVQAVRRVAAGNDLQVVVCPQVGRDASRSEDLARLLDGELVAWDGLDHVVAEKTIRGIYRRASFVVSDRLHALILGHSEGAVPLGVVPGDPSKVARGLAAAGAGAVALSSTGVTPDEIVRRVDDIAARRGGIVDAVLGARATLAALRETVRRKVGGER